MLVTSNLESDPRVSREADITFRNGYEVTVICRTHTGKPKPYQVITLNRASPSIRLLKYVERLLLIIAMIWHGFRTRPDIIHCNDLDTLPAGYVISLLTRAKLFYDAHEYYVGNIVSLGPTGRKVATRVEGFICRRAARISTVCDPIADLMASEYKIPRPLVLLNPPYYVDALKVTPRPWRAQFGDKIIALFQGQYSGSYTGLADVIRAAELLPENVVVVLRGFGPLEAELRELIEQMKLSDRVFLVAPVPMSEMVESAVGADMGLMPLNSVLGDPRMAVPNKLFEYMMAGLPLIVPDLPGPRSFVVEGEMGIFYQSDNYERLAEAITALATDPARLQRMKQYCLDAARQYCWDNEGLKLIQAYNAILEKKLG